MEKYLISIIMPTYNRGYIIKNAILSVLEQTVANWELIIVDDASTDNTDDIVKDFTDSRIIYIRNEENKGANYSRNRGCILAKGEFLAFIDSDNIWEKNKLEKQLMALHNSADDVALTFCKVKRVNEDQSIFPDKDFNINQLKGILRTRNVIDMNTVLLKKEVFEIVGGFDDHMPRLQDWDIFFRIIVVYHYMAIYIPEILDSNIVLPDSISRDDYKYQSATIRFLEKYYRYLELEDIMTHFILLMKKAGNKEEGMLFIEDFIGKKKINTYDLYTAFAGQFYDYLRYYRMLLLWKKNIEKREERTIFSSDFKWRNSVIALYGLGVWGDLVYSEAKNCGIRIEYGIDKKVEQFHDVTIVNIQEIPETVELIIVSIFQKYDKVCKEISKYYSGKIISIEDLIKGGDMS